MFGWNVHAQVYSNSTNAEELADLEALHQLAHALLNDDLEYCMSDTCIALLKKLKTKHTSRFHHIPNGTRINKHLNNDQQQET